MAIDRDLNVAFVRAWGSPGGGKRGWDMLAATGVRGLRLLGEGGCFASISFGERDPLARAVLKDNLTRVRAPDRVRLLEPGETLSSESVDYVDVDPYGSPLPFLPAAFDAVSEDGVVAVTATDLAVLAGANSAACERRYSARPIPGRLGPEGGLRILIAALSRAAAGRGGRVEPLLSYVLGHHLRTYVHFRFGPDAKPPIGIIGGPDWDGPPLPREREYGPMWTGPLFDRELVQRLEPGEGTSEPRELARLIERFRGEAKVATPFVYEPNELARSLRLSRPPRVAAIVSALEAVGFPSVRSHVRPAALRTLAPRRVVEQTVRSLAAGAGGPRSGSEMESAD